ncbi:MAG TPA: hypothetical protein VFL62_11450 [Bradyrhizobium sp.]|uniref:hypothetical protein n=1 Tax=Bradyrhizobium sp. TaxID=376 RepID=UPI002D80CD29|nr:hypothetical protein [Bradyrhizobium sp.]HET7886833.1 hypothetical protein [Bradyrhizobium sp.]
MDQPAKDIIRLLSVSLLIMLAAAAINFVVDPLQLLRTSRLFTPMYSQDSRMQNAGLIRSQSFDTAFMGTSLAIHFHQRDIDRVLGVKSLKLAMTGSSSREQVFVLAAAMARKPNRVIWEIDDWIFHDAPEIDADANLPADLYRGNIKGFAAYLFDGAMAKEAAWIAARSVPRLERVLAPLTNEALFKFWLRSVDDINALQPGEDVGALYNAGRAISAYRYITDPLRSKYLRDDTDYDMKVRVFERDAIPLIRAHPEVTFDIYLPPYSVLQWVALRETSPDTLKSVYAFSALFCRRMMEFPNVRLFDFRGVKDVTHDLNNYSDVIHHSPAIDLKVLAWLAEGKYRVDAVEPTKYLDQLKAQVEAYRLETTSH